jgi:YbgC/YbaW family acyl-CoA thioester hydrolase
MPAQTPLPTLRDFRYSHSLRVRWAEVDMQKIVFNAHYLMYLDTAVADYWRALALPYEESMHQLGGDLYVAKATLEYKASAKYADRLEVCLRVARVGNSSIAFQGAIFADHRLLLTGELIYVYANPSTQKSMPVPEQLRALFNAYEAGETLTHLQIGSWEAMGKQAMALRTEVFVTEQGVLLELEHDEYDAHALHAVVTNRLGQPVATGRLIALQGESKGISKIGRMAVKRVLRGGYLGRSVLEALLDVARSRGDHSVLLHAQATAKDFYAKQGFVQQGEVFEEAGIPHVEMRKNLA